MVQAGPAVRSKSGVPKDALDRRGSRVHPDRRLRASKTLQLTGALHIPKDFVIADKTLVADIGGFVQSFQLTSKGAGKNGKDSFKITIKVVKKKVPEQDASFTLKLNNVPDTVTTDSPLIILIGGTVFAK